MKWLFCVGREVISDWEHDLLIRQNVNSIIDDNCNLSDWMQMYQDAERLVRTNDIIDYTNQTVAVSNLVDDTSSASSVGGSNTSHHSSIDGIVRSDVDYHTASTDLSGLDVSEYQDNLVRGVSHRIVRRAYRRRRRVMAYGVVCLINKARAKYFNLDDNPANRKLLGQYLTKIMRERNFRDCDIPLHVNYAVDCYFTIPSHYRPTQWIR